MLLWLRGKGYQVITPSTRDTIIKQRELHVPLSYQLSPLDVTALDLGKRDWARLHYARIPERALLYRGIGAVRVRSHALVEQLHCFDAATKPGSCHFRTGRDSPYSYDSEYSPT
jgi:hypothetical protein